MCLLKNCSRSPRCLLAQSYTQNSGGLSRGSFQGLCGFVWVFSKHRPDVHG